MELKNKLLQNNLTIVHPNVVEIMATVGFGRLVVDMEHTSIDLTMVQILISTIQARAIKA